MNSSIQDNSANHSGINITPLIDVVLMLSMAFIVTLPFLIIR